MFNAFISALSATATEATESMSFSDRTSLAGIVSLEGMLIIFSALTLLWIAIEVMHFALHRKPKAKTSQPVEKPKSVPTSAPVSAPVSAPTVDTNNDALIAVITAAVSAAMAQEGHTGGFRVVSFKRVSPADRRHRF